MLSSMTTLALFFVLLSTETARLPFEMGEAIEIGSRTKGKGIFNPNKGEKTLSHTQSRQAGTGGSTSEEIRESQSKDWRSMVQSYDLLLTYAGDSQQNADQTRLSTNTYNSVDEWQLTTIDKAADELGVFHNRLRHIFGVPGISHRDALGRPQDVLDRLPKSDLESYNSSIWALVSILEIPMTLPKFLHHIQIAGNDSILQTIAYIRKYNLASSDVAQTLKNFLKTRHVLDWQAKTSMDMFRSDTRFDNAFHWRPYEEVHLEHHFQLPNFNLSKEEKDWYLFRYLASRMNSKAEQAILENQIPRETFFRPTIELIQFAWKLKEYLLKELDNHDSHQSRIEFLRDRSDDLVRMVRYIIEPTLEPGMRFSDLNMATNSIFATLDFIMDRFGSGFKEEGLLDGHNVSTGEFRKKFKLIRLATDICIWRNMLFDYDHYIRMYGNKEKKIPSWIWKERKAFYWKKLMESIASYKTTREDQLTKDPGWEQKLQSNLYYQHIVEKYDLESRRLEKLFEDQSEASED
ncbi:hypothetical protein PSTT_00888, partial [Puccinia striiformis]